jgi:uncharacterized protein YjiK
MLRSIPLFVVVLLAMAFAPDQDPPVSRLAACAARPDGRWVLPAELTEVSGLALEGSSTALAHGDEVGRVYRVTPETGATLAAVLEGEPKDDFEGIALAGRQLVLSTSDGRLYIGDWPPRSMVVAHRVIETGLGKGCALEGLGWDTASGALLLPCNQIKGRGRAAGIVIRRWHLTRGVPLFDVRVPAATVARAGLNDFRPSAIEVDSRTGNWLLLSARPATLLEITPEGAVVRTGRLAKGHRQAEGLALTRDGDLLVADEAAGREPTVTRYRCPLR